MVRKHVLVLLTVWISTAVNENPQILKGPCPTINFQRDFTAADFNGIWYENGHYNRGFADSGDCISYNFSTQYSNRYGYNVDIMQRGMVVGTMDLRPKVTGKAAFNVALTYPDAGVTGTTEYSLYILGTDFQCVASVYMCRTVGDSHISSAFILSKDKTGLGYLLRNMSQAATTIRQIPDLQSVSYDRNEQIVGCRLNTN